MKTALIIVGILSVALVGIAGLSGSPDHCAAAPGLTLRSDSGYGSWCQSILSEIIPSLRPVQFAEEEEEAAEEEAAEEGWPPAPPDRVWTAIQLA